jgi:hypothetical protein
MKFILPISDRTTKTAIAAACGLLICGSAYAVTSNVFQYSAPKNGFLAISNMAFAPADSTETADYGNSSNSGLMTFGPRCFTTGLNFPNGATVVKATVWYRSGSTGNVRFLVYRNRFTDGDTDGVINDTTITDHSGAYKSRTVAADPAAALVENNKYAIGMMVCMDDGDVFHHARIHYTYTNAGD